MVLQPDAADEGIDQSLERVSGFVSSRGGEVGAVDRWGRRRLAYPINRHFEGLYVVAQLKLDPAHASDLEGTIRLSEDVMRHLLIRKDEE